MLSAGTFIYSADAILLITGELKILSLFGSSAFLDRLDPVFGITFRQLFLVAGVTEVLIALCCLLQASAHRMNLVLVAWVSTSFLIYRVGLVGSGWEQRCRCLGDLPEIVGASSGTVEWMTRPLLLYLLLGSYVLLALERRRAGRLATAPNVSKELSTP